ncbi:MAG: ATPase, T2SS/T4P/T4SS family [Planctomycetaceae bacterium]
MIAQPAVFRSNDETNDGSCSLKIRLHRQLVNAIDLSKAERLPEHERRCQLRALAAHLCEQEARDLSPSERSRLADEILAEIVGFGPIDSLMSAGDVTEIVIHGPDSVFIERNGCRERANVRFNDADHLRRFVQHQVRRAGRHLDASTPQIDAKLPDGSRFQAILPPRSPRGPIVFLRPIRTPPPDFEALVHDRVMTSEMANFLRAWIEARANLLLVGESGAGTTTLLNSLGRLIPESERIVTLDEAAELDLRQPDVITLQTTSQSDNRSGQYSAQDILRNALQLRPDRIVIGDLGGEAGELVPAMADRDGCLAAIRSADLLSALNRLEHRIAQTGVNIPSPIIRQQIVSAVPMLVHLTHLATGERKIARIAELHAGADGRYQVEDVFIYRQTGVDDATGRTRGAFYATGHEPRIMSLLARRGVKMSPMIFHAQELGGDSQSLVLGHASRA